MVNNDRLEELRKDWYVESVKWEMTYWFMSGRLGDLITDVDHQLVTHLLSATDELFDKAEKDVAENPSSLTETEYELRLMQSDSAWDYFWEACHIRRKVDPVISQIWWDEVWSTVDSMLGYSINLGP